MTLKLPFNYFTIAFAWFILFWKLSIDKFAQLLTPNQPITIKPNLQKPTILPNIVSVGRTEGHLGQLAGEL